MKELADLSPMPFGKYKGKLMQDVPANYLHWLWTEAGYSKFVSREGNAGAIADYISRNLHALKQEYPDGLWN
jgi:uncharacterized protein (DUF3820 family)